MSPKFRPYVQYVPIAGDFVRCESDQREDGWRQAAFHPDKFNRMKYTPYDVTSRSLAASVMWLSSSRDTTKPSR